MPNQRTKMFPRSLPANALHTVARVDAQRPPWSHYKLHYAESVTQSEIQSGQTTVRQAEPTQPFATTPVKVLRRSAMPRRGSGMTVSPMPSRARSLAQMRPPHSVVALRYIVPSPLRHTT